MLEHQGVFWYLWYVWCGEDFSLREDSLPESSSDFSPTLIIVLTPENRLRYFSWGTGARGGGLSSGIREALPQSWRLERRGIPMISWSIGDVESWKFERLELESLWILEVMEGLVRLEDDFPLKIFKIGWDLPTPGCVIREWWLVLLAKVYDQHESYGSYPVRYA